MWKYVNQNDLRLNLKEEHVMSIYKGRQKIFPLSRNMLTALEKETYIQTKHSLKKTSKKNIKKDLQSPHIGSSQEKEIRIGENEKKKEILKSRYSSCRRPKRSNIVVVSFCF